MIVGASCTAELIQDDPGGLAKTLDLPIPVVPLELPSYQKKENWGAAETFYRLVRAPRRPAPRGPRARRGPRPRCNILGPTALGFRHRDDVAEIARPARPPRHRRQRRRRRSAPRPADLARLGEADFNVVLYPEIAGTAARWLQKTFGQPLHQTVPIGVGATARLHRRGRGARRASIPAPAARAPARALPWYSRSVDSTYLTGKRVFIFGDATHALAAARIAATELGFTVVGLGTYSREFAREVREAAAALRHRGADHRRLSRRRGARSRSCSPSSCSARRWSATSPSAWACPAR